MHSAPRSAPAPAQPRHRPCAPNPRAADSPPVDPAQIPAKLSPSTATDTDSVPSFSSGGTNVVPRCYATTHLGALPMPLRVPTTAVLFLLARLALCQSAPDSRDVAKSTIPAAPDSAAAAPSADPAAAVPAVPLPA